MVVSIKLIIFKYIHQNQAYERFLLTSCSYSLFRGLLLINCLGSRHRSSVTNFVIITSSEKFIVLILLWLNQSHFLNEFIDSFHGPVGVFAPIVSRGFLSLFKFWSYCMIAMILPLKLRLFFTRSPLSLLSAKNLRPSFVEVVTHRASISWLGKGLPRLHFL